MIIESQLVILETLKCSIMHPFDHKSLWKKVTWKYWICLNSEMEPLLLLEQLIFTII